MKSSTGLSADAPEENITSPRSLRDISADFARCSAISMSYCVQVGDLNITVSETMAAARSPAIFFSGTTPLSLYMVAIIVAVLPRGSFLKKIGALVCMSASL